MRQMRKEESYALFCSRIWLLQGLIAMAMAVAMPAAAVNETALLLAFKNKVVNGELNQLSDWKVSDTSPCQWNGITCDPPNTSVIGITIVGQNLSSPLSPEIFCQLPNLTVLDLNSNNFNEEFPGGFQNCSKLATLNLSFNSFWGNLPDELSNLRSLTHLDVSANNLSGEIPKSLGVLAELQYLNLWSNQFSGAIPPELGNLTNLTNLTLCWNKFSSGFLPDELGKLSQLTWFTCAACGLQGSIPAWTTNWKEIQFFDFSQNNLSGHLPGDLFIWPKVQKLELYFNSFTGPIPPEIGNLTTLTDLDLSCNFLNGTIPKELERLKNLELLNLWNNSLTGEIPRGLANLPKMQIFQLFQNKLTGTIPQNLGTICYLTKFDVSTNQLTGPVPRSLCNGGKLLKLIFFNNAISGSIPEEYGSCQSLIRVRLGNNLLTGTVPSGLWGLPQMSILELFNNSLHGIISADLITATRLGTLSIYDNHFNGWILEAIGQLQALQKFYAYGNNFSGPIPQALGLCSGLTDLCLNGNALSGSIPEQLGNLSKLTHLDLSDNRLSGHIPASLGGLEVLTYLNLAQNQLSGEIPSELSRLEYSATTFNLSFNDLSGSLPFQLTGAFNQSSFEGNSNLCIPGLPKAAACSRRSRRPGLGAWVTGAVFATAAACLSIFCFFYKRNQFYDRMRQDSLLREADWTLIPFEKLSFTENELLSSLDEDNVIGRGGSGEVYRAFLKNGQSVAVKKLWVSRKGEEHCDYGFKAEVETLGKIRHTNIVKLLCCCSNKQTSLLVYEYMPNGSVGDLLHGKKSHLLDWRSRFKIALGAAQGLAYLHDDCLPPIIHRDVKSNNILLDADYEAHIADFGLAKILQNSSEREYTVTGIAGSVGYIAPEFGYSAKVNEKCDVYSFGVVLLELVTGKRPTEPEFGVGVDIVRWVNGNLQSKAGVTGLLDPKIVEGYQQEMLLMLKVAIQCTSASPSHRPSMREVVELLQETDRQLSLKFGKGSKSFKGIK